MRYLCGKEAEHVECLKEYEEQQYRSYVFYHDDIELFTTEFTVTESLFHFICDIFRLNDPADKYAGQQCNYREKDAV